ncbi:hypothetical protein [uncultured Eubacterium sp.]|uniref:hypothetical protein n=1 Tax=uncultured Eubacterium sp. TaxID=165185 RepID=UPI0025FC2884|nr:hypothetical protein [uncultured Eubacterium sp.]
MSIVMLIIWIVCLVLNIKIAKEKNRNVALWVVLSIFFSWITLIINLAMKPKEN